MASAYSSGSPAGSRGGPSRPSAAPVGDTTASEHRILGVAGDDDRTRNDALGVGSFVEEGPRQTCVIDLRGIARDVDFNRNAA